MEIKITFKYLRSNTTHTYCAQVLYFKSEVTPYPKNDNNANLMLRRLLSSQQEKLTMKNKFWTSFGGGWAVWNWFLDLNNISVVETLCMDVTDSKYYSSKKKSLQESLRRLYTQTF